MKFLFLRRILILIAIKLIIIYLIHKLYTKYVYSKEKCEENVGIVVRESFRDLNPEILTNRTIYFLETFNSSDHKITPRQACAIESAAIMNPDREIVVLFLTSFNFIRVNHWPHFRQLSSYENIHFRYFHVDDFIKDTPLEHWMKSGIFTQSEYKILHLSDMLRYALLYKYSGLYLDLDVIVLHSIDDIKHNNFACLEENRKGFQSINNAIIKLSDDHGHSFAHMLLNGVVESYDGKKQWQIGPRLITKSLKKFCGIDDFTKSIECKNFEILPVEKCYAIQGNQWYKFYRESHKDSVLKETKDSYFVHLWNFQSSKKRVDRTRNIAFNTIAFKYCPLVYADNTYI